MQLKGDVPSRKYCSRQDELQKKFYASTLRLIKIVNKRELCPCNEGGVFCCYKNGALVAFISFLFVCQEVCPQKSNTNNGKYLHQQQKSSYYVICNTKSEKVSL
jgi:hypothetical protein